MNKDTLLNKVNTPKDIRSFSDKELRTLSDELRQETIDAVSGIGGHLGAGLGVVELTVALHAVFNTPDDRLIWDVGHQAYPHKILTGRKDRIRTIRKDGGLAPFTKRAESEYDPFGTGHSSTSISAAVGMAAARDHDGTDNEVIAVIGDGAMSGGMAFEALNNAGSMDSKLIVILNDNDMSIAPPVGAFSAYLSRLISSKTFISMRKLAIKAVKKLPHNLETAAKKTEQYAKNMTTGGNFFEEMGFYYIGPIDGHNLEHLLPVLRNVKESDEKTPILIHIVTEKGKGFDSPEQSEERHHAVKKFDIATRIQEKSVANSPTYTSVFAESLEKQAEKDNKIVAITAAMPSGTGLNKFAESFPDRIYDVGIAEQHAVTFAAGLATEGYKPFVAIYSTFLQRGYDQIVHDVAIQKLPVRFAIDRAGLVGADGPTHAGSFDIAYLLPLPNFVVMAPSDEQELSDMIATSLSINDRPSAFRYPRGEATGCSYSKKGKVLEIGKGKIVKKGNKIAILSLGTRLEESLKAANILEKKGLSTTVADARFAKPIDTDLVKELVSNHDLLITIEEGSIGGFGSHVLDYISNENLLDGNIIIRNMYLPDSFIEHGSAYNMYEESGLNCSSIVDTALKAIGHISESAKNTI